MEPTLTIIEYLWDARNTWFDCQDKETCDCTFESRARKALDESFPAYLWLDVEGSSADLSLRTSEQWDELVGPKAQMIAIDERIEMFMAQASELVAIRASYERLGDE